MSTLRVRVLGFILNAPTPRYGASLPGDDREDDWEEKGRGCVDEEYGYMIHYLGLWCQGQLNYTSGPHAWGSEARIVVNNEKMKCNGTTSVLSGPIYVERPTDGSARWRRMNVRPLRSLQEPPAGPIRSVQRGVRGR